MKTSAMMRCPKCEETSELDNLHLLDRSFKREWVGLTDEEAQQTFARHNCTISTHLAGILTRAIEAKLKEKNGA